MRAFFKRVLRSMCANFRAPARSKDNQRQGEFAMKCVARLGLLWLHSSNDFTTNLSLGMKSIDDVYLYKGSHSPKRRISRIELEKTGSVRNVRRTDQQH